MCEKCASDNPWVIAPHNRIYVSSLLELAVTPIEKLNKIFAQSGNKTNQYTHAEAPSFNIPEWDIESFHIAAHELPPIDEEVVWMDTSGRLQNGFWNGEHIVTRNFSIFSTGKREPLMYRFPKNVYYWFRTRNNKSAAQDMIWPVCTKRQGESQDSYAISHINTEDITSIDHDIKSRLNFLGQHNLPEVDASVMFFDGSDFYIGWYDGNRINFNAVEESYPLSEVCLWADLKLGELCKELRAIKNVRPKAKLELWQSPPPPLDKDID